MTTGLILGFILGVLLSLLVVVFDERHRQRAPIPAAPQWRSLSGQPLPGTAAFTILSAMSGNGCLGRSQADEPVFVLCARDRAASMAVRDWADLAEKLGASKVKVLGAKDLADRMAQWRERHGGGKVPD